MKYDRQTHRFAAVYRCMSRYGASKEWAICKLEEVGVKRKDSEPTIDGWLTTYWFRNHPKYKWVRG